MKTPGYFVKRLYDYSKVVGAWQTARLFAGRLGPRATLDVRIKDIKATVKCRLPGSDQKALGTIFVDHDCDVPLPVSPRLIIDGGANVGYASVLLANLYPEAVIIAVEPNTENFRIAQENCRAYPNVRLVQGGIWSSDAHLAIVNPDAQSWAFVVNEVSADVPGAMCGYSIAALMAMSGLDHIDVLKLDIEGAEEAIFAHPDRSWIDHVTTIIVETHGPSALKTVQETLAEHDFSHVYKFEKLVFTRKNVLR